MQLLPEFPPLRTFAIGLVFWVVVAGVVILLAADFLRRAIGAIGCALWALVRRPFSRRPSPARSASDDYATYSRRLPPPSA